MLTKTVKYIYLRDPLIDPANPNSKFVRGRREETREEEDIRHGSVYR